jgi:hypothetical protein
MHSISLAIRYQLSDWSVCRPSAAGQHTFDVKTAEAGLASAVVRDGTGAGHTPQQHPENQADLRTAAATPINAVPTSTIVASSRTVGVRLTRRTATVGAAVATVSSVAGEALSPVVRTAIPAIVNDTSCLRMTLVLSGIRSLPCAANRIRRALATGTSSGVPVRLCSENHDKRPLSSPGPHLIMWMTALDYPSFPNGENPKVLLRYES